MKQVRDMALEALIQADHRWQTFQTSYPGWQIWCQPLTDDYGRAGERISWTRKVVVVDSATPDLLWRVAHAIAHVRLHRGVCRAFTLDEEREANECADFWFMWTGDGTISHVKTET